MVDRLAPASLMLMAEQFTANMVVNNYGIKANALRRS